MNDKWFRIRLKSLYQQGRKLFFKKISFGKSECSVIGCVDPLKDRKNIIMFHGLGITWQSMLNFLEEFASEYNTYVFDMPWNCSRPCPFITLEELTEWTLSAIKLSEITKPIVLTHSFGGEILLNVLGKAEAGLFEKLIIVTAGWFCESSEVKSVITKEQRYKVIEDNFYELTQKSILAGSKSEFEPDLLQHMTVRAIDTMDRKTLREYYDVAHQKAVPFPKNFQTPILLISGEYDTIAPKEELISISENLNGSHFCIPKARHYPHVEQKEAFYKVVWSYLRGEAFPTLA